ncbi:hypothetical protein D3Z51_18825 [Clostridiaceae bacterium]|nr:hypothetical protein [Clostridiaceae bacterium]RKI08724.1 hypothetical protein D7V81_18630 [bacterium 1XD21-70]
MDKYEFNLKIDQIRKMVNKDDYVTAKKIADAIDWNRVPNANLLSMVSRVYEKNGEYRNAKAILLMAFERAPIGKRLLYKLTELALKEESTDEAEDYYREFCDLAGDDPRQYLLRYMILKQRKAPKEQMIHALESYTTEELDEKWLYELALLYHENGDADRCVNTCDRLTLMFGLGKYVDKAIELKQKHTALSKYQIDLVENREKYEEKLRKMELSIQEEEYLQEPEETEEAEPGQEKEVPRISYEGDLMEAEIEQAEAERYLAQEMSHIEPGDYGEGEEDEMGKTRVLGDIRRTGAQIRQLRPKPVAETVQFPEEPPKEEMYLEAIAGEGEPTKEPAQGAKPSDPEPPADPEPDTRARRRAIHLMIEARTPERGMDIAVEALRQVREFTGIKNPVAKITGSRLNKRGVLASAEKLAGKDLMVEEAGDMDPGTIGELERLMSRDNTGMRVILIDNPQQIERLEQEHPSMAEWFDFIRQEDVVEVPVEMPYEEPEAYDGYEMQGQIMGQPEYNGYMEPEPEEGMEDNGYEDEPEVQEEVQIDDRPVRRVIPVRDLAMRVPDGQDSYPEEEDDPEEEMDIDAFAQYACQYATDIDCSITGKSMLALYERIEIMEEDGLRLTKENAEALIEEAADRAEKPSLGKAIKGIFASKYNKDGLLILREEHFI